MVVPELYRGGPAWRGRPWTLMRTVFRTWRRILAAVVVCYVLVIISRRKHPFTSKRHIITNTDIDFEARHSKPAASTNDKNNNNKESNGFLPLAEAQALCRRQKWQAYPARDNGARRRKIYDLVMMNNELDWLEIRLETMAAHVDYFVIVEAGITFTGLPKPLVLRENWARFERFHSQIIHRVLEPRPVAAKRAWDNEDYQRNAMLLQGVMGEGGEAGERVEEGDVLIVADVDEVPRPATLLVLRECDFPPRVSLRTRFFYYGFQWEHRGPEWGLMKATVFRGKDTILPVDLRNGEGGSRLLGWWDKADLWNSGWHCSSCFGTIDEMLDKMSSFSHMTLNKEIFRERTRIVDRFRKGKDLWDRKGLIYDRRENNGDIPQFVKQESKRFGYLLNRDGTNGGFTDYVSGEDAGD